MIPWTILLSVATGLIIFLYGIENFSREIQRASGNTLRKLIAKLTKNRFNSLLTGAGITALIQSSSATTVITVGLVNAGIISFVASLGIIFGANIGTTITAQLIALKLGAFAPIFIIGGFLLSVVSTKYKFLGKGIFYFGLVFFSLTLISTALEPVKNDQFIIDLVSTTSNIFIALLIGIIFTAIVQSSSVTTGIVVVLAGSGIISLAQGIPIIIGATVGTTITAALASLKLNIHAKRVAAAHFFFNISGAIFFMIILIPFTAFIESLGGSTANQIANALTIISVVTAIFFMIILKPFAKFIEKVIPGRDEEILFKTKYLEGKLPKTKVAFRLIEKELRYSLEITVKAFEKSYKLLRKPNEREVDKLERLEALNDLLDKSIEKALIELSKRNLTDEETKKALLLMRMSNNIEQLADLADDLGKIQTKLNRKGVKLAPNAKVGIDPVYEIFIDLLKDLENKFPHSTNYRKVRRYKAKSKKLITQEYHAHMQRALKRKNIVSSIFVESTSIIKDSFSKLRELVRLTNEYVEL